MFAVEEFSEKQQQAKSICVILNGNVTKHLTVQLRHPPHMTEIGRAFESKWNFRAKRIRIFNAEGVEYFEEDLEYVKMNENVYISRGEDFDSSSNFGEYEIIKPVGEGGFGKVFLGKHKMTQELVAIKVMKTDKIENAHQIDVVFREAENLKSLNHPNIVKIYNCYSLKGMEMIFVMEYMDGGELLQLLQAKERLTEEQAKIYFKQIVSAINHCHFKNIIHRDLKLENILLKSKGSTAIKVADFGISGVADRLNPDADTGTLKYMSPEVLSGKEKGNSPTVDVWAMGCLLYCMLVGRLPFDGSASHDVVSHIVKGDYKIPSRITISKEAKDIIERMLDVNPATRIKTQDIQDHPWLRAGIKLFQESSQSKRQRFLPQIKKPPTVVNLTPKPPPYHQKQESLDNMNTAFKKVEKKSPKINSQNTPKSSNRNNNNKQLSFKQAHFFNSNSCGTLNVYRKSKNDSLGNYKSASKNLRPSQTPPLRQRFQS